MDVINALKSRWKEDWDTRNDLAPLRAAFHKTINAVSGVPEQKTKISEPGTLSRKGVVEQLRTNLAKEVVPDLRRALWEAEKTRNGIKNERMSLAVPKPDKADLAAALLRQELRAFLRNAGPGDQIRLIMEDEAFAVAAFEGPAVLSGLTNEQRTMLESRMIDEKHATKVTALEDASEAVDLAEAAIKIAINTLRTECEFEAGTAHAFDAWMAAASVDVEREIIKEKASLDTPPTDKPAFANLEEINKFYNAQVDEITAKIFPELYPDHPINKQAA